VSKRVAIIAGLMAMGIVAGCRWPWEPEVGTVTGVVRYRGWARANVAFVGITGTGSSYTDWTGHYSVAAPPPGRGGAEVLLRRFANE